MAETGSVASLLNGERLVFIGGLHRSGTSIVHRCLSDHPDIGALHDTGVPEDEGQHLQSVYVPAHAYGGPGVFGFCPEAHLDERSRLVSRAHAERLLAEWTPYWDLERRLLIEKTPQNLIQTRFLQGLFPECRFIVVLRHPVAVSYATQKWTSRFPWLRSHGVPNNRNPKIWIRRLIEHWLVCHELFEDDRPSLKHVLVLHYEDFVEDPQRALNSMFAFLDVEPIQLQREVRDAVNDRYWAKWMHRRTGTLTRFYASGVIRAFEERVTRFGYSLLSESLLSR